MALFRGARSDDEDAMFTCAVDSFWSRARRHRKCDARCSFWPAQSVR